MNDERVGKAFVQNFRILLKNLLKKLMRKSLSWSVCLKIERVICLK